MFYKKGELLNIDTSNIQSTDSVLAELDDNEINERFKKFAVQLKRIAPKADDFLYFSTRFITAAEAALINENGSPKLDKYGKPVTAIWENTPGGGIKWVCSDPNIRPFKNANGDIFPETELLKAYKKWVEKPLCVDHKSDQVDAVRGIILDTYYDRTHKCGVALCALDKVSFPELARGITGKYKTSVSMGTRVKNAICTDCGQVATTEREFCQHMRSKSSYGEINVGLDPLEISLVVSGADHTAKIRTILAAANTLRSDIESKEKEVNFIDASGAAQIQKAKLEQELKSISDKLIELKASIETDTSNIVQNNDIREQNISNNNALVSELQDLRNSVYSKFEEMEKTLSTLSHKVKEETMSNPKDEMNKEAYFQGGGGASEPAPNQVKYPKDPMNEHLRESGDKHMVSAVNTGSVEGMFPGDKEKKELIQRAEVEERAQRRTAALKKAKEKLMQSKQAYFQGGGEANEPTPGKKKYTVDPLDGKVREKEDKQMVGQKPFPDVGDVDGLHPSPTSADEKDELKRKKMLQRASLKAKFIRVAGEDGAQDLAQSGWQVSRGDEVLFTATVDEITDGNADKLYDAVATKEFGTNLLEKVNTMGAEKVASIYKKAQAAPMTEPAPVPEMAPMPMPETPAPAPVAEEPKDMGASGDPKETVLSISEELQDRVSDLLEAARLLAGEQAEMGELEALTGKASAGNFKKLVKAKKVLNSALVTGMKKAAAELSEHKEELNLITDILNDGKKDDYTNTIVQEAIADAKTALADTRDLLSSFIKYTDGSKELSKQAQALKDMPFDDEMLDLELETEADELKVEDVEEADMNEVMMDVDPTSLQGKKVEIKASEEIEEDLTTKEGRAALRAKLAAKAEEFAPVLDDAHKLTDQKPFETKPSDDLGKVENIEERHKVMRDVAEAPAKVRKEAARLNQFISEGKVAEKDLEGLVAQGLDPAVVKYWKEFYGEAGKPGSEFATGLLKEHAKAQLEEEVNKHKVKIARAYELTNEMVRRGLVSDDRAAITAQVEDIMQWNDEGFEAMKRVVSKHALKKSASFPQVGMIGSGDPVAQTSSAEVSLQDALDQAFSGRRF